MESLNFGRRGQVWVETVVYTLIGLSLIGLVLAILTPQIKEFRDRNLVEQTIDSFNVLDAKITEVLDAPGNRRKVEFGISRGNLYISPLDDSIRFELFDSESQYSEPGINLSIGRVNVRTLNLAKKYNVILSMNYVYNITFNGEDSEEKEFNPASIPYVFFIDNKGFTNGVLQIDISN